MALVNLRDKSEHSLLCRIANNTSAKHGERNFAVLVFSNLASLTGIPTAVSLLAVVGNAFFALLSEIGYALTNDEGTRRFAAECWNGAHGSLMAAIYFFPLVHQYLSIGDTVDGQ